MYSSGAIQAKFTYVAPPGSGKNYRRSHPMRRNMPPATCSLWLPGCNSVFFGRGTNMGAHSRPIEVLLVEDNPADVRLTQEAFKEGRVTNHLSVVADGVEAMEFLHRATPYESAPRPDLILLDLNLPKKSGREVLEEIKADPVLRRIPVMILSTSRADQDLQKAYNLHANCYITKPVDLDQFLNVVRSIEHFWFNIVTLPSE